MSDLPSDPTPSPTPNLGSRNTSGKFGITRRSAGDILMDNALSSPPTTSADPSPQAYASWCAKRKSTLCHYLTHEHSLDASDFLTSANQPKYGISSQRMFRKFCQPKIQTHEVLSREDPDKAAIRTAANISSLVKSHAQKCESLRLRRETRRAPPSTHAPLVLILDNLRSAYNVGAIIRIAETAGCAKVYACGITPFPPHPKLERTARAADCLVDMEYVSDTLTCVSRVKAQNYHVIAMEEGVDPDGDADSSGSVPYCFMDYRSVVENRAEGIALVIGAEMAGVDKEALKMCHGCVEIPMLGLKASMNVSTATSVVVFEIVRQLGGFDRFRPKSVKKQKVDETTEG